MLKSACTAAGLDPKFYSVHSLRKGGATVALLSGVDEVMVKAQGDWISDAYRRYITFSMDQRLSVPMRVVSAMKDPDFERRCQSLAIPMAASLYSVGG